jgi:acyl carrier protein
MGLDAVEIVMKVEDAFDIRIEDGEAEQALTPGQLIDFIMSKVETTTTDVCLTHRSFNVLRTFLVRRCAFQRSQIRPDTKLQTAFPPERRRERLRQLSTELAIPAPPELVRPEWLKGLVTLAAIAAAAATFTWLVRYTATAIWLAVFAGGATVWFGIAATQRLRTEFPKPLATVAELSRWVMTHKSDLAVAKSSRWTRDQVAARVREIVVAQLGCESTYQEDANFIKDLGLG